MTAFIARGVGLGAPGHGGEPSPYRTRPDLCTDHGHPGITYNPWHDETWCLCGAKVYDGEVPANDRIREGDRLKEWRE